MESDQYSEWLPMTIALSVLAVVLMTPACFKIKERTIPPPSEKKVTVKEMLRFVAGNKYILIFFFSIIIYTSTNVGGALGMYLARHNFGNEGVQSLIGLAGVIPGIILGIFIPKMSRKVDKFYLLFWSMLGAGIVSVIMYFVGYESLTLFIVFSFIKSIPIGMVTILKTMFTPDCVEYGMYKTGIKAIGIGFAVQTFSTKLMIALASSLGAATLAIIGFVEGEGAAQVAGFTDRLWFVYTLLPPIGTFLALPVLWKYKLRDVDVQIMTRFNRDEISRDEADERLKGI